jgi:hypothetical protein
MIQYIDPIISGTTIYCYRLFKSVIMQFAQLSSNLNGNGGLNSVSTDTAPVNTPMRISIPS